ncbi:MULTISPECIES: hypothetical protein [unclassified Pseudoalteromonas]|uniref:hypothetical protein n=1 Tax=unclassified Pseudoalteromonas TaxID=194690 RepID=UPI000F64B680|nr:MULTISPECIES: hypothetical protein [unclassified Pseudoalteromonas]RRS07811.1 hypothetical protein EAG18_15280 [Pseudoalteromonas sp. J010]RXF03047.1 hypothetical protein D9603_09125 [Pseudoalteromonas sp. PS5]
MSLLKSALIKTLKSKSTQQVASVVLDKALKQGKEFIDSRNTQMKSETDELVLGLQHLLVQKPTDGIYSISLSSCKIRVKISSGAIAQIDKI